MIRKLLITAVCCASLINLGCASMHMPTPYKIDVPQGNIITQEMVNQLHPGMSKKQVSYAMGTPLVVDVFHPERWDYIYSLQSGRNNREQHRVTLYFEKDLLARIEGDYHPQPSSARAVEKPKETTVIVTPPTQKKGFFSRLFGGSKDEPKDEPEETRGKSDAKPVF